MVSRLSLLFLVTLGGFCQAEQIIDDFEQGPFTYVSQPSDRGFQKNQDLPNVLGGMRQIRLGSFAPSNDPMMLKVDAGALSLVSPKFSEGFSVSYGNPFALDPPAFTLDVTGKVFEVEFGYYRSSTMGADQPYVGVAVSSQDTPPGLSSGVRVPFSPSAEPFTVAVPVSAFNGPADLTGVVYLGFHVDVSVPTPGTAFEIRSIRLVPEPSAEAIVPFLLATIVYFRRRFGQAQDAPLCREP